MYDNDFFIKYGIIYDTPDGCRKYYICANQMWLLYVLAFTYIVVIDTCINYTGHGISKICGINKSENSYLRQKNA